MRLPASLAVACLIALAAPFQAHAWDAEGHRIIAALAYERLTPNARRAVDELISHSAGQDTPSCPVHSLEEASTWPDCVGPIFHFRYLRVLHYEDVPLCGVAAKVAYCPGGRCVTDATRRAVATLANRRQSPVDRLEALEEVAHFVGDLHQPLHAADNGDRGGNEDRVQVSGHETTLHHIWDDEAVIAAVGPSQASAEAALRPLIRANAAQWSTGDVDQWLAQAHGVAVSYAYGRLAQQPACGRPAPPQVITQAYLDGAAPLVRVQLARGAVRLAVVLNDALGR